MLALVQRVDVPLITLMPHEGTWLSYVEKHSAKWNHMQAEPAKFVWLLRLHCCHRDILSFSFCLSSHCCNKLGIICVSTHLWKFELFGMCIPIMESWLGERGQSCCQCQIFFQASHVYNHHMQLTYSFFFSLWQSGQHTNSENVWDWLWIWVFQQHWNTFFFFLLFLFPTAISVAFKQYPTWAIERPKVTTGPCGWPYGLVSYPQPHI